MADQKERQVEQLQQRLRRGEISRREFLRIAMMLGLSAGAGELLAGCAKSPAGQVSPTPVYYEPNHPAIATAVSSGLMPQEMPTLEGAGAPAATSTPRPTTPPRRFSWLCVSCGQEFISVDMLRSHAITIHGERLPEIARVEQPTYQRFMVGKIERFDEKNTALSRSAWDTAYQAELAKAVPKKPRDEWAALEGQAQLAGAIYVDDTVGVLDPRYTGYMGHRKGLEGLYSWEDPLGERQYPVSDPAAMAQRVKQMARFYGADLVGITKINPNWIYSSTFTPETGVSEKLEIPYRYAVVMGIETPWEQIRQSPGLEASAAVALGYSRMAELAASLAKYIRALGYPAVPCGNDTAQSIPLAIDAGLGELGRNGLLITPQFGPRQRLCKVLTDLPLQTDLPIDFGMSSFCETCFACAHSCPAKAINGGERTTAITSISNRKGLLRWAVDTAKCYIFWRENGSDCSNCVSACPWALRSTRDWLEG